MEQKDYMVDALVNVSIVVRAYSEYGAEIKAKEDLETLLNNPDVGYHISIIEANGYFAD